MEPEYPLQLAYHEVISLRNVLDNYANDVNGMGYIWKELNNAIYERWEAVEIRISKSTWNHLVKVLNNIQTNNSYAHVKSDFENIIWITEVWIPAS